LKEFDRRIPEILANLREDDLLVITADHGCDPSTESTDHSREYVPLLVYGKKFKSNVNLVREAPLRMLQKLWPTILESAAI